MPALRVVVVASRGFSPFHFSVPLMVFGKAMPQEGLFKVDIAAEQPGVIASENGLSIHVGQGLESLANADIVIVPF